MVAVQVHRVRLAAVVDDAHPHHVALGDDEHRHVGEHVTVDRPPDPGTPVQEAGAAPDLVVEPPVGPVGVVGPPGFSGPSGAPPRVSLPSFETSRFSAAKYLSRILPHLAFHALFFGTPSRRK